MTLGEMRTLLDGSGIRLTRSLGQNFLHDANQIARIVRLAGLQPGAEVIEIGPGLGPLTEVLLKDGLRVRAIEKDRRLAHALHQRLHNPSRLEIIVDDALDWLRSTPPADPEWHVVANLPYSVGSAILVELAHLELPPRSVTVTLQAEVVDRLRAQPGTAEFGLLTLLVGQHYVPGSSFRIPASCFFPAPKVTSACIRLERRAIPFAQGALAATYRALAKLAFSQRRKHLRKVLRTHWPEELLRSVWIDLDLAHDVRAETLGPEVFARLAQRLHPARPS